MWYLRKSRKWEFVGDCGYFAAVDRGVMGVQGMHPPELIFQCAIGVYLTCNALNSLTKH